MTMPLDAMLLRLHLPTVRRLYQPLAGQAETDALGYADYLERLMSEEVAHRGQTRIERAVRKAQFPFLRTLEEFNFTFQTSVRQTLLGSYLGPEFVASGASLILFGPPGTGKTHLAIAMAYRAIQHGADALFTTAAALMDHLSAASRDRQLRTVLSTYTHPSVLVIDEVGYLTYGSDAANVLFQVVNERYLHKRPMLFTTNKPVEAWGQVLHDGDLAEAILDRVLERGRLIHLKGPSYRTKHLRPADKTPQELLEDRSILSGKSVPKFPEPTKRDGNPENSISISRKSQSHRKCSVQSLLPLGGLYEGMVGN